MCTIRVWIGNYGAYNEGYLIDQPAELPMSDNALNALLQSIQSKAERLTGYPCEEMYISDYDGIPFDCSYGRIFSEYTPIHKLNTLAQLMEEFPDNCEIVEHVLNTGCDTPDSILGIMNWIIQAEELPYYAYDAPQWASSEEEKFGWTLASYEPWYQALEDAGVSDHFDIEDYGRSNSFDVYLGNEGYVDPRCEFPQDDKYTYNEIKHMLTTK